MSERDNAMAAAIAAKVVDGAIEAAQDPERMGPIARKLGTQIQIIVGRAVLRALFYILIGVLLVGSIKFDWLRKGLEFFGTKG